MGAMNTFNLASGAFAARQAADELKKQGQQAEPPWQRTWWVDLYTADDGNVRIRARLADLRTEAPMIQTAEGWQIGQWAPFAPKKDVLKLAHNVIKRTL